MVRKDGEPYLSFCERVTQALQDKKIDYAEWSNSILEDCLYETESTRRCAVFFSRFLEKLDKEEIKVLNDDTKIKQLKLLKEDIIRERKKLQDTNREYQENIRRETRNNFLEEKIVEAINKLEPIKFYQSTPNLQKVGTSGVLVISDLHYDSTYTLYGLYGEVVNKYDKEICKARMNMLLNKIAYETDVVYDDLLVVFNGDLIENVLRMSSLTKLREPVVDSIIELSEFLSNWLNELQAKVEVPVKVAVVGGNHGIIRSLGSKPIDDRENLEKIIHKFIELRLANHPNITIEPYSDVYFSNLKLNNILFLHGEDNDLASAMDYFENYFNIDLDYIVAGHYHRSEAKTVGVGSVADREIIRVPSLCGTDTYAKKMRKNARAGAMFMTFTEEGRSWSKNYCLN